MYKLDRNKAVELEISNDAYYLFTEDEEPLDDASYDEINALYEKYESFEIEKISELKNGLIKILLIPYIEESNNDWDYYFEFFNNWILNIKVISEEKALIQCENTNTGKIAYCITCDIITLHNKKWLKYKTEEAQKVFNQIPFSKAIKY